MTENRNGSADRVRYINGDFFLLRTPALPVSELNALLDKGAAADHDEMRAQVRTRLRERVQDPEVHRALTVASSDLTDALPRLESDPDGTSKKTRRVYSRVFRYMLRMATRATPFGRFSGVALGEFADTTTARLGRRALGESQVRVDMAWLLRLIKQLESDPQVYPQLRVTVNSSVHLSGENLVLPHADVYGERDNRSVRIRATSAVHAVLRLAAAPVPYTRLTHELELEFPAAGRDAVTGLLDEMWELNILTSDLRPPLTSAAPTQHLTKQLSEISAANSVSTALERITDIAEHAGSDSESDRTHELSSAQQELLPEHAGQAAHVDTRADLRGTQLTHGVGRALADAVDCLMRLSEAAPGHNTHLAHYRDAFNERYGLNALVPVLDVLSPDGLDAPPTYLEPVRSSPLPPMAPPDTAEFESVLTELAAQAWCAGQYEIELTDSWLRRLAPLPTDGRQRLPLYPALDVYAQIHTDRPGADLDHTPWRAVLREDVLAYGGRTYGRFFNLLEQGGVEKLREFARQEEAHSPEAVHAELCYLPPHGRAANVALRPQLRRYEIPINTPSTLPSDQVLTLDDLLVGATEERFFLWSRRLGKEVIVSQAHMLSPQLAPNVVRFLLEVSSDGYVMPTGFRWAKLSSMPFLPRVVRNNVVLHPAQWTVEADTLTELDAEDFASAIAMWRKQWKVPRHVYLVDEDNRLLLDLEHPSALDELAADLYRGHRWVTLHEMLPGIDQNWLTDEGGDSYISEIVVPLVAEDQADTRRSAPSQHGTRTSATPDRGGHALRQRHVPGGPWMFAKIYCPPDRHDEIIAWELREKVATLRAHGLIDRWHYIRYMDPQPHLRLRFRRSAEVASAEPMADITEWGRSLVERGIAFDMELSSYTPEIERYGGPLVFDEVERMFEANSDMTAQLVALLDEHRGQLKAEHVAVAAVEALYTQWGLDLRERRESSPRGEDSDNVRDEFRKHRDYLSELLAPWDPRPHPRGRQHHELLAPMLSRQAGVVATVSGAVRDTDAAGELWGTAETVLGSLAHMQVNRLMPIDLHRESRCYALWKHALRLIHGRPVTV